MAVLDSVRTGRVPNTAAHLEAVVVVPASTK